VHKKHWSELLPQAGRGHFRACPEHPQKAQQLLRQYMRAWIESGYQFPPEGKAAPEGKLSPMPSWAAAANKKTLGEEPGSRNFEACEKVFKAMEPLLNCTLEAQHTVWSRTPRAPDPFILHPALHPNPSPRGLLAMIVNPKGGFSFSPGLVNGSFSNEELAAWAFLRFWQSPWLFTLMRCASCGIFAIPAKVRKSYKRGWLCAHCRNSVAARAATQKTRKDFHERWFRLAITACRDFESHTRRRGNDKARFITERVNDQLSAMHHIKRNTITRNLKGIQAAVGGGNHATRKN